MRRGLPARILGRLRERKDPAARPLAVPQPLESRSAMDGPPIFVIGCHRSGTSLVRRILDSHSRIACPPESKFIVPLAEFLRKRGYVRGFQGMGYGREEVARAVAAFAGSFFETYARAQGKVRWADKTPNYVDCLPELWDLFGPDAQFIVIVRHGLDVAFSLSDDHRHYPAIDQHVTEAEGNVPLAAGRFWADQNGKIEEFVRVHPASCHHIRYEELTTRPDVILKPMFEFLGEPWESAVLDYNRFTHTAGWEDADVRRRRSIEPNSGRYLAWPPDVQQAVRKACEPMLSRLGY